MEIHVILVLLLTVCLYAWTPLPKFAVKGASVGYNVPLTQMMMNPKMIGPLSAAVGARMDATSIQGSSTPTRTRPKRKVETDKDTKKKDKTEKESGFAIKESRSIADEIEAYFAEDNFMVILYNDPINKRAYVSGVLQDVFKWDEMQADAVMLQAHTYGFAVAVETSQERAEDYVEKLLAKGLIAEARKSGDTGGEEGGEG